MSDTFVSDNAGHRVPPHPDMGDPVEESGQNVSAAAKDVDETITVVPGKKYAITCIKGAHIFGIATTATAKNCIWACGSGQTIVIVIPSVSTYTSLHFQTPDSSRRFILRRLKDTSDD